MAILVLHCIYKTGALPFYNKTICCFLGTEKISSPLFQVVKKPAFLLAQFALGGFY